VSSLAFLLGVGLLAVWFGVVGAGLLSWDGVLYARLAHNLTEGIGYRLSPDGPLHLKYFPGYPLLVAFVQQVLGSFPSAAGLISISSAVIVFALVACAVPTVGAREAIMSAILVVTNATFLIFSSMALSEIPFAAVSLLFLFALTHHNLGRFRPVLMVLSFWGSCLIRPEGLFLVVPLLVEARRRSEPWLLYSALLCVPAAWWIGVLALDLKAVGPTYRAEFMWPSLSLVAGQVKAFSLLGLCVVFLAFVGAITRLSTLRAYVSFAVPYLLFHLAWSYTDVRLYASLVGILCMCAGPGLVELALLARLRWCVPFWCTAAVFLSLSLFEQLHRLSATGRQFYQLDSVDYLTVYDALAKLQLNPSEVSQSCDFLLTNEQLVYSYILGEGIKIDSYADIQEVTTKICAEKGSRTCIASDRIHRSVWSQDVNTRISEISRAGCVTEAPLAAWYPLSGYYLEIYRCAQVRCPV
jgi:hypothetical protein